MSPLPSLNGLRAFEAAARTGSFVTAAAELNVSPSAISRLVKLLEQRLGVALFERLPNGLHVTERGSAYLADLTAAFERISQATERVKMASSGALLIGAGPTLAMRWLIPRLTGFHELHPDIDVRLSTAVAEADPMRPDWTAAIRAGDQPSHGLSRRGRHGRGYHARRRDGIAGAPAAGRHLCHPLLRVRYGEEGF